jgi:hypothetical protein
MGFNRRMGGISPGLLAVWAWLRESARVNNPLAPGGYLGHHNPQVFEPARFRPDMVKTAAQALKILKTDRFSQICPTKYKDR